MDPVRRHRLANALQRFDAINIKDPHGRELLYAQRMTARLASFAPDAPEVVQLAVRAQHIGRWQIPRSDYPDGRAGYLTWRTELAKLHADLAEEVLRDLGYDGDVIERVRALLRKRGLKTDPEVQLLEDVACLVFLEHEFHDFAKKHDAEKIVSILQKTWKKMSPAAHKAALALDYAPEDRALVERALA